MKKKMLHFGLGCSNIGGIETFLFQLASNIDKTRFQMDFLTLGDETPCFYKELSGMGCRFFSVTPRKKNWLKNLKELENLFKKEQFDIFHHNIASLSYTAPVSAALKHGCRVIVHSHNSNISANIISKFLHKLNLFRLQADKIIKFACSETAGKYIFGDSGAELINNGIDTEKFIFDNTAREQIRKELGIENKFVIGHVGRFTEQKNHVFLIDIFKEIRKDNNNAVLLLIGGGDRRGDAEKKIELLDLKDNVIFMGVRSDIPQLLCAMDIFLFPSVSEGLGTVLIEAQANGLRCFASDVIPKESKVTDLIKYISLNKSAAYWAGEISADKINYERKNMSDEIRQSGYDIKEVVRKLESFYSGEKC